MQHHVDATPGSRWTSLPVLDGEAVVAVVVYAVRGAG